MIGFMFKPTDTALGDFNVNIQAFTSHIKEFRKT